MLSHRVFNMIIFDLILFKFMQLSKEKIKNILIKMLPDLTKKDIDSFIKITNYEIIGAKEIIIKRGNRSKKAFLIIEGTVRGYFISETGKEKNILLRGKGFLIGDARKLFNNEYQRYTYEAIPETHVLFFNYPDLEALASKNLTIMRWLSNIFKEIIIFQNYRIETMITMPAKDRYIDLIKKNPTFLEKTYAKYIADFLGITPVSLSRIIKEIKKENNPS